MKNAIVFLYNYFARLLRNLSPLHTDLARSSVLYLWDRKIRKNPNPFPIWKIWFGLYWFGAGNRTWTCMKLLSLEPESSASANSAIPAKKKMVGGDGFEPSKSVTADLQSAPFGHSGTYPRYSLCSKRNFFIIARIEHFCQYKNRRKMQKKEKKKTTRQNHVVFSLIDNRLCGRNNFPASAINPARRNTWWYEPSGWCSCSRCHTKTQPAPDKYPHRSW